MPKISALILSTLILLFTRIGIANATANVGKVGPVADFRANSMTGTSLFTVAFIDISTGGVTSWSWDFEDGSKSVERHPVHTFAAPGIYSVRLLVVGPQGADTKIKHITVASPQRETASHTNANTDLNLPPSEWPDIGEVQADYDWTRVTFKKPLLDPVSSRQTNRGRRG
jgi:PKD repeat protein